MSVPLADYTRNPQYGTTRDGFGKGLVEAAEKHPNLIGLCADLTESTRMEWFADKYPERFVEMGVAEENMVGVAAGLALGGKKAVAASYAVFSPGNSLGPLRSSVCYSNLDVKIIGGHSGMSAGPDGATHQALEDLAVMRTLPNMTVVVPCDQEEARKAMLALADQVGPGYLRTGKHSVLTITTPETPFLIGRAETFQEGKDIAIIAVGVMVAPALDAAAMLEQKGISAKVINMHTIKPLDLTAIADAAQTGAIVTAEEHQVAGGLGSAVAEAVVRLPRPIPIGMVGVNDSFGESGETNDLMRKHGLNAINILDKALEVLQRK